MQSLMKRARLTSLSRRVSPPALLRSMSEFPALLSFFHVFARNLNVASFTPDELEAAILQPRESGLFIDIMWALCFDRVKANTNASMRKLKEAKSVNTARAALKC